MDLLTVVYLLGFFGGLALVIGCSVWEANNPRPKGEPLRGGHLRARLFTYAGLGVFCAALFLRVL